MLKKSPTNIERPEPFLLSAEWTDGFKATISIEELRKACPCAECTGEKIGDVIYSLPKPVKFEPRVYELTALQPVGNYAITASWGNGHDTGIYSWELFRKIFEQYELNDKQLSKLIKKQKNDKRNISFNIIK